MKSELIEKIIIRDMPDTTRSYSYDERDFSPEATSDNINFLVDKINELISVINNFKSQQQ